MVIRSCLQCPLQHAMLPCYNVKYDSDLCTCTGWFSCRKLMCKNCLRASARAQVQDRKESEASGRDPLVDMLRRECRWQKASCTHHPASDHIGTRLGDQLVKLADRIEIASRLERLEVLVMLMCMPVPGLACLAASLGPTAPRRWLRISGLRCKQLAR